ncbi:MAG: hypothetical protein WC845_01615 [Candidatus Staskawiczbacteria bacterium]|jgi:hypothetical protein
MRQLVTGVILIVVIIIVAVLSQQPYFETQGNGLYKKVELRGQALWQAGENYWNNNIVHRATTEIEKRQDIAKDELKAGTKQISKNAWEKMKDYFSDLLSGLFVSDKH